MFEPPQPHSHVFIGRFVLELTSYGVAGSVGLGEQKDRHGTTWDNVAVSD